MNPSREGAENAMGNAGIALDISLLLCEYAQDWVNDRRVSLLNQ